MKMTPQLMIDFAVIVSITILGALRILPAEAVIAVLSALGGARVAQRNGDDSNRGDPPTGAAAALVFGIASILTARRLAFAAALVCLTLPAVALAGDGDLDVLAIVELAHGHAWIPLAALVVGFLTRLLKTERAQSWLGPLPAAHRPKVALLFGVAAGVLDGIANGTQWHSALIGGVLSALIAMGGHDLLIESIRGGREVGA